ncbi:MarR family winged helix-turn-helix transcriptional regulator [Sulfitobacter sabulilitoris]|uniref:MarR family winged helix-turn-helix transcriptional regulator n=1 Tax=Sulfitobacter sabulilitoris TaxID=2562655 RepID=UPI001FE7D603|nr:MarR family transcriptional regulator [Sulfitobacter sabulilitoris]
MKNAAPTKTIDAPIPSLAEVGLEGFAPYLMNRIMGRYNASVRDDLAAVDLTTPKMRILAVLSVEDGLMVNELSVFAVAEQSTMSRTLDQMEEAGWIQRRADEKDSRARRIYLTAAGRHRFEQIWPALSAAEARMFKGISPRDRAHFMATLITMLHNIRVNPI